MRWRSALLATALILVSGCKPVVADPAAAVPVGDNAQLAALVVAQWAPMAGYSRDRFPHWVKQGDGCDTRETVLRRDGQGVATGADCEIILGTWISPYDGVSVTNPKDLDIDHLVPLGNAWQTGAQAWTDAKRSEFANDLTRPQLLAVSLSSNRSKGDQDPSQWKPPNTSYWCEYAQRWVTVKAYWKLSVTTAEKAALTAMLGTCV